MYFICRAKTGDCVEVVDERGRGTGAWRNLPCLKVAKSKDWKTKLEDISSTAIAATAAIAAIAATASTGSTCRGTGLAVRVRQQLQSWFSIT